MSDKPVAVFAGNQCAQVPIGTAFCDHLVEQIPSTATWGTSFLTVPLATRLAGDIFRVVSRDDATDIFVDGALADTIDRGDVFETDLASGTFHEILTSAPALVMQYSKGSVADDVTSDPFQMMIPPTEQFLSGYTLSTPAAAPVAVNNFVNVVIPTADTAACTIDGFAFGAAFIPIGVSGFSAAQEPVAIGSHVLSCPSDFGAYSYGFASFESYGYPGGLALAPIAAEGLIKELTSGPLDGDGNIAVVVEVGQLDTTEYDFTLTYANPGGPPVLIVDTAPAEWIVTEVEGDNSGLPVGPNPEVASFFNDFGTVEVFHTGKGAKSKSSTKIHWRPDPNGGALNVLMETRQSPGKNNVKFAPTSCGPLFLNSGLAKVFEVDPVTGEPLRDPVTGELLPPLFTAEPLVLAAVEDLDGGGVVPDGSGDEDGDGRTDIEEVRDFGSDPCVFTVF